MSEKLHYLHSLKTFDAASLHKLSEAELLSLAQDGELPAQQVQAWTRATSSENAAGIWQTHLLIGEVLRAQASPSRHPLRQATWLAELSDKLAAEVPQASSLPQRKIQAGQTEEMSAPRAREARAQTQVAANDGFWKLVAGGSTFAGIAAIAVAVGVTLRGHSPSTELAAAQASPARAQSALLVSNSNALTSDQGGNSVAQVVQTADGQAVVIRDARLLEKMAQHRMLGAAGVHAGNAFVRHAAFDQRQCAPNSGADC